MLTYHKRRLGAAVPEARTDLAHLGPDAYRTRQLAGPTSPERY